MQLAGIFARFVANLLDAAALWGVLVLAFGFAAAGDAGAVLGFLLVVGAFVGWLYLLGRGVTPGKAALGLRVRKTSGEPPGLGTMLVREWFAKYISALFLYIGYVWAIFDPDRQTWHDKIAGTVVVKLASKAAPLPAST